MCRGGVNLYEEQNGANFSLLALSSEELWVLILASHSCVHAW